jgi:FkbM family methyltransferase
MSFNSQFGQERVALEILGHKHRGVFVDIGATDGFTRNNTWVLEKEYGWSGVCVEPVLASYLALTRIRACQTLHACVGGVDQLGVVKFHEDPGNHEVSKISHSGKSLVPCLTLNLILDSLGIREVDYLSIDTEGNELNILRSLDYSRFPVRVIGFEHNDHWGEPQRKNKEAIHAILTANGYAKHMDIGVDSIYKLGAL